MDERPADVDHWLLAGMPGPLRHAAYLVERLAPQYRLIVDVLLETQSYSLTGVARTDLPTLLLAHASNRAGADAASELLVEDSFDLDARMAQLHEWGVVEVWQDRAETEADFLRNRDRYQLTPRAAVLHRFVLDAERETGAVSSTALLAPTVIATRLEEFVQAMGVDAMDLADQAWAQIELSIRDMAAAAGRWQAQMAAALAGAPSLDKLETLRATLLAYIEVWGSGVDVHSGQIAEHLDAVSGWDGDAWRRLALARLGAAADADGLDVEVANHVMTLTTLLNWFAGPGGQGVRLRRQVRDVIGTLVRGHRTLLNVGGALSRRTEFLRVAAAVERTANDHEAWSIWCRATALFGCRHLSLQSPQRADEGPRTSFWDASPVPVQARLRAQGPRAIVGRPARIPDLGAARAAARARAAAERRTLAEAEAGLRQRSGRPLSSWGTLTEAEFDLLLDLLATPRGRPDEERQGFSPDGRWLVRIVPLHGPSAVIGTPAGNLVCGDALVELRVATSTAVDDDGVRP